MKRLFTKLLFVLFIVVAFFIIVFQKDVHASTEEVEDIFDETIKNSGKIMMYDAITDETTEVDMEEIRQLLKSKRKTNEQKDVHKVEQIYPINAAKKGFYQPLSIFPPSERWEYRVLDTSEYPNRAICKATYLNSNGEPSHGTAAIVANNLALTAAHCIWDENTNAKYEKWVVHAGKNESYQIGPICGWTKVYYSPDWHATHHPSSDWALCVLGENVGQNTGCFGASSFYDEDLISAGSDIISTGYPGDRAGGEQQWYATGKIDSLQHNYIVMTNLVSRGYSGGPIAPSNDPGQIIGVIQGKNGLGFGIGARITDEMINIIAAYR